MKDILDEYVSYKDGLGMVSAKCWEDKADLCVKRIKEILSITRRSVSQINEIKEAIKEYEKLKD